MHCNTSCYPLIHNSFDMPHGGVIATLVDNAMGFLVNKDLHPEGKGAVTTNMTINYIKASSEKQLIATSTYLHKGRQTLVMECTITQPDGKKIAHATGSFLSLHLHQNKTELLQDQKRVKQLL